jgi:integrase
MATRQRGNGLKPWQADASYKGKRERGQFATEKQAKEWEALAVAAMRAGRPVPQPEEALPTGRTIQQVHDTALKLHWANLRDRASIINAQTFVKWVGALLSPEEALTADNIERFVSSHLMDERKVSGSTINRYLSAIGVLVRFAKMSVKPDVSHLWRKEGEGRVRFFSTDEEALIIQTLTQWQPKAADFFVFLVDTGARTFSEAGTAPWRDFGNRRVTFWETKTNKPRTVPLTVRAWDAVQRYRDAPGLKGPFTDMDRYEMDRLYNRVRVHLPQLEDTVLYTARHTCCSRLVQGGADLRRVMEWMGHKNITTTMRYAHLAPKHLMDIAHILEPATPTPALVVNNG